MTATTAVQPARTLRKLLSNQIAFLAFLIVILSVVTTIFNPAFISTTNLLNILNQISVPAIAAGARPSS